MVTYIIDINEKQQNNKPQKNNTYRLSAESDA